MLLFFLVHENNSDVYPTAFKSGAGIVFIHGLWMAGELAAAVSLACISETIRCRKLILGREIGSGV